MEFMISIGFVALPVDTEKFGLENEGTVVAALVINVDDLLIIDNKSKIGQIKDKMKNTLRIHGFSSICYNLGMSMEHNRDHHMIEFHQGISIQMIMAKFSMFEFRPVASVVNHSVHPTSPMIWMRQQLSVHPWDTADKLIMDGNGQKRQPGMDRFRPQQSPAVIYRHPWTLFSVHHKNNINLVYTGM